MEPVYIVMRNVGEEDHIIAATSDLTEARKMRDTEISDDDSYLKVEKWIVKFIGINAELVD